MRSKATAQPRKDVHDHDEARSLKAFRTLLEEMDRRTIAVAIFRAITSHNPTLVVRNKTRAENLRIFLQAIIPASSDGSVEIPGQFTVLSKKKYKEHWKAAGGRELCLVENEVTVKNPGVEVLEDLLSILLSFSSNPVKHIKDVIIRELNTAKIIKNQEKNDADIGHLSQRRLNNEIERRLLKYLLQMWQWAGLLDSDSQNILGKMKKCLSTIF